MLTGMHTLQSSSLKALQARKISIFAHLGLRYANDIDYGWTIHVSKQLAAYLSLALLHCLNALGFVYLPHVEVTLALGCRDLCCQLLLSDCILICCSIAGTAFNNQ